MKINLNLAGEDYPESELSVSELLARKRWSFPLLIVKINGRLVPRSDYGAEKVRDGDEVEAYHLVSGG